MKYSGTYYDGKSSKDSSATIEKVGLEFLIQKEGELLHYKVVEAQLLAPVGNIPAKLVFSNGASFEIHEGWQELAKELDWRPWVHLLETSWRWATIAAAGFVFVLLFSYFVIIPIASNSIAQNAPEEWVEKLSHSARNWLDQSEAAMVLEKPKKEKLDWASSQLQKIAAPEKRIKVIASSAFGANAFALPDGSIYITEELVDILSAEEIYAVLLHEMGHVKNRHGLALLIKSSFLSLIFFSVFGGDWMNVPVLFFTASYSRDAEREADLFAKTILEQGGFRGELLASALEKISAHNPKSSKWLRFLQSHPLTEERIRYLIGQE
jgi:Zn-dependent protease with chaperone function